MRTPRFQVSHGACEISSDPGVCWITRTLQKPPHRSCQVPRARISQWLLHLHRLARIVTFAIWASFLPSACLGRSDSKELVDIKPWIVSATARCGVGYRDNVLLSSVSAQGSAFGLFDLQFFSFRVPVDDVEASFFVEAEHKQFATVSETDSEQLVIATAQIKNRFAAVGVGGISIEYSYINQVLDASTTELDLGVVVARGHNLVGKPRFDVLLGRHTTLQLEGLVSHQWFERPLDDYLETGGRIGVGHEFSNRSTIELSYHLTQRDYSTRQQVTQDGTPVTGSELSYEMHRTMFRWRHNWNKAHSIRTIATLGLDAVHDNGSGFFDYQRYFGGASVGYDPGDWSAKAQITLSRYNYAVQRAHDTGSALRHKTLINFTFTASKRLSRKFAFFAEYEHERSIGNADFDEYEVNTISAGLDAEL